MKILPKPQGHDMREKRADKASDSTKWLPKDAMYQASQTMQGANVANALVVAWYEKDEEGVLRLKYRSWQEHSRQSVALAADLLHDICA